MQSVSPPGDKALHHDEERKQLRPYRVFLALLIIICLTALCGMVLRGIVNTLDRLPSTATMQRLDEVDVRALRACADDLGKLEGRIRERAGDTVVGEADLSWEQSRQAFELERLQIVARCRLDEPGADPAVQELARAATALENVTRTYTLLFERLNNQQSGHEFQSALGTVRQLLKNAK